MTKEEIELIIKEYLNEHMKISIHGYPSGTESIMVEVSVTIDDWVVAADETYIDIPKN